MGEEGLTGGLKEGFEDSLVAYALGTLSPDEAAEVETYLQTHPEAARTVRDYLTVLSDLVMTLPPEPVPAGAERALLARIRREPLEKSGEAGEESGKSVPSWRWWLGAGMAAKVAAGLWLSRPVHPPEVRERLRFYSAKPGATEAPLLNPEGRPVGTRVTLPNQQMFLALDKIPPEGRVYEAWCLSEGEARSLGTWEGYTFLAEALTPGGTLAVTLEPSGGSPQPTGEPQALVPL